MSFVRREPIFESIFPDVKYYLFALEDVPSLSPIYTSFESNYDGIPALTWSMRNYWLAPFFTAIYLISLYYGRQYMSARKPYDLKEQLKYWNLFLAIFSSIGAIRIVPHLIMLLWNYGFFTTICGSPIFTYGRRSSGLWTMLFIYSKYFELIDTAFIILRKKHLSFLHWYHHATVLLYTWDAFVTAQPAGLYFIAMNYTVHAVMYFYYYLAAARESPPKWGMLVTFGQIAQMMAGVVLTTVASSLAFKYKVADNSTMEMAKRPLDFGTCELSKLNILAAAGMYSTYFYLFAEFFVRRYFLKSHKKSASQKSQ